MVFTVIFFKMKSKSFWCDFGVDFLSKYEIPYSKSCEVSKLLASRVGWDWSLG